MFSELFESVARPSSKRKRWALVVSGTAQMVCLLILILVPLIYTQALQKAILNTPLVPFSRTASRPAAQPPAPGSGVRRVRLLNRGILIEPPRIPPRVSVVDEPPLPPEAPLEGPSTASTGVDLLSVGPVAADQVSQPAAAPSVPQRVILVSTIEAAKLVSQIHPVYPALAMQARIQGDVVLHAIISKDGGVSELQVLSGHPLLVNAALDAVRKWRYSPTLLSGRPVEVETTITVSFVLGQ